MLQALPQQPSSVRPHNGAFNMKLRECMMLLFVLPIVSSCKKDLAPTNANPFESKVIIPLKVGNQWTYRITTFDSSGHTMFYGSLVLSIVNDTVIQNERWFLWNDGGALYTNRRDGYWLFNNGASLLYVKYPASKGDIYRYGTDSLYAPITRIISIDSLIAVPMGIFSCFVHEWREITGDYISSVSFYSPNIGLIREDLFFPPLSGHNSYLAGRLELVALTIN
jgi:hypothetical protein